jgi:hypothetical protein
MQYPHQVRKCQVQDKLATLDIVIQNRDTTVLTTM